MKVFHCILFFILTSLSAAAQHNRVQAAVDTTKNKIGAQFNLSLKTTVSPNDKVIFPTGPNFGRLEVIRDYITDTVQDQGKLQLVKKYGLTQFDSGRYSIPRLRVLINNQPYFTDSISVEVANVAVDTLKQKMYDIKPILGPEQSKMPYFLKILAVLLLAALIGFLIYWLIRRNQLRRAQNQVIKTPIERATYMLQTLEQKALIQKGEIKSYYSELTDIARNYIEEAIHIPAMESTTSELIGALKQVADTKKMVVADNALQNLEDVLRQADLVKFAKSRPALFEIESDRHNIEKVIVLLDKSVPELSEDEIEQRELLHQQMLARQRKQRIAISAGAVVLLLVGTVSYFISTRGFDFVKDNVLGHPTKELIEREWVSSEYGNPGIIIETPEVLRRIDTEKSLPKDAFAMLKEFQSFEYGSIMNDFYVSVSTNTYKGNQQIDLYKGIDGMINVLELQGAKNVLVKQDEFKNADGLSGVKAYGSFMIIDPDTKDRKTRHYEALLFGQQNGLQQIVIVHEDGDKYGEAITQRILNSVELKSTATQ